MCTSPETYYTRDPAQFNGVRGLTKDSRKALSFARQVIPCGKCIECRLAYAAEWSLRCMHELQTSEGGGCFVTLTYDDDHLPADRSLHYEHFQLFMHRLRNAGYVPRFFMCGEYGDNYGRPHYHAILFNVVFDDLKPYRVEGKIQLYKSAELARIWGMGFVTVGAITRHSCGYVARYSLKKISGAAAGDAYQFLDDDGVVHDRVPPFSKSSNRPGIGYDWFVRYQSDVFPHDNLVFEGKKLPVPRYYKKLHDRFDPDKEEVLKRARRAHAVEVRAHPDNAPRRLRDRWEVSVLNSANAKRNKSL